MRVVVWFSAGAASAVAAKLALADYHLKGADGSFKNEPMPECSLICAIAEAHIEGAA